MLGVYQQEITDWAVALEAKSGLARENARRHLVEMGLAATPVLETLLQDTRTQVRWEAAMAMKEIADPGSVPSLIDALEDEDRDVRWVAAEALADIGEDSLKPLLESLVLRGDSLELREGARLVFSQLQDFDLRYILLPVSDALEKSLPPEGVRVEAGKLLGGSRP
ncbi:MAG: HEAT repeat domain-containing protein [Gemmatimonadota bacterium]